MPAVTSMACRDDPRSPSPPGPRDRPRPLRTPSTGRLTAGGGAPRCCHEGARRRVPRDAVTTAATWTARPPDPSACSPLSINSTPGRRGACRGASGRGQPRTARRDLGASPHRASLRLDHMHDYQPRSPPAHQRPQASGRSQRLLRSLAEGSPSLAVLRFRFGLPPPCAARAVHPSLRGARADNPRTDARCPGGRGKRPGAVVACGSKARFVAASMAKRPADPGRT